MEIKPKLKKLRDEFKLSHVLWFFTGILVTVAFNWIVYKDPKRITAPGISALVAMSTFMLALWSAFKVNKWLNSKVNEKGFKKCENIVDNACKAAISIRGCNQLITRLSEERECSPEQKTQYDNLTDEISSLLSTIRADEIQLPFWGFRIVSQYTTESMEGNFNSVKSEMDHLIKILNLESDFELKQVRKNISINMKIFSTSLKAFFTNDFNEIFIPSPQKKNVKPR